MHSPDAHVARRPALDSHPASRPTSLRRSLGAFAIVAGMAGGALAQDAAGAEVAAAAEPISPEPVSIPLSIMDGWTLQFELLAHYIAPAGDITMPNSSGMDSEDVSVDEVNIDDNRVSPYIDLHLRRDKWRISVSGFWFSLDDRGATADETFQFGDLAIAAGDELESSFDFWTLEAVGSYRVFQDQTERNSRGVIGAGVGVDLLAGVRLFDVDFEISAPAGTQSADNLWAQPVAGARMEVAIWEDFGFDVTSAFGYFPAGDSTSFSWDIVAAFHWRPWENVGIQIGYQQLAVTLEDGDDEDEFKWEGGMAGLFGGVLIRF